MKKVQVAYTGPCLATSGTINNYKSGMALKFNVYDKDFSLKDRDGMVKSIAV
jgi:hypothetical protein